MPKGTEVSTIEQVGGAVASLDAAFGTGASPKGRMTQFNPMAAAEAVAPMYSMTYLAGIAQLAQAAVASHLYGDLTVPQATMILQTGLEMGIPPTVALRNIASFKGKTTISGQLMLAKVKAAGYQEDISENTPKCATISIQKTGRKPYSYTVTMDDAVKAGWAGRNALYQSIPATMLLNRAIGFVCRYGAPEVAAGLYTPEEMMDVEEDGTAAGGTLGATTYTQYAVVNGWDIPAQEEFADLMDKVYQVFKATGHADDYPEFEDRWKKNKSADPAETVLGALRKRVERLTAPATAAPTAPAVASGPPPVAVAPPPPPPPPAPKAQPKPIPTEEPKVITGWTADDQAMFEDLVAQMRDLSPKAGEADGKGQHRINFYYQERDKGVEVASLLSKMGGSVEKLNSMVKALKPAPKPAPEPEPEPQPVQDLTDPDAEENPYAVMDPDERRDLMKNLWETINGKLAEKGIKSTKASKECQRLFEEWTAGVDPDNPAAIEAAVVLGQEKWVRNA